MSRRSKRIPLLLLAILSSSTLTGQEESSAQQEDNSLRIENVDEAQYIRGQGDGRGILRLEGRLRVYLPEGYFVADRVIVDTNSQELSASGNLVYYQKGKSQIEAERLIYSHRLQQGIIYNISGRSGPLRFSGKNIRRQGSGESLSISQVRFTADEARPPHYSFSARRLWFYDDGSFLAAGVWYYIGGIPILPLPFFYSSFLGSGIITQVGRSNVRGFFLQNSYQFGVPQARNSPWAPTNYRLKLDYYQNSGEMVGTEISRLNLPWNYYLDLGLARHRRYEILSEKGKLRVTNRVIRCNRELTDCKREEQSLLWHKIFLLNNYSYQNSEKNNSRSLHIRFEHYRNYLYEYEYGERYIPRLTPAALYTDRTEERHPLKTDLDWQLNYSEQWDQLSLQLKAERRLIWRNSLHFEDSDYEPAADLLPWLNISYNWLIGRIPFQDAPLYWKNSLQYERRVTFEEGRQWNRFDFVGYRSFLRSLFSFSDYLSLEPSVGYGLYKTTASNESDSETAEGDLLLEAQRNSYQYLFSENEMILGPQNLFLRTIHRYKRAFAQEEEETPHIDDSGLEATLPGNQQVNETELSLEFYPLWGLSFSAESSYDHRAFPQPVRDRERWDYPIVRGQIILNWFNLFRQQRENLLSRRRARFLTTVLSNSYIYDPVIGRDHSNIAAISLEMGGFDLWFLKHLRYLETALYWYHVYFDPSRDHIRFILKNDLQLWSWGYLEVEWESRVIQPERYSRNSRDSDGESNYLPFLEDIGNSSGLLGGEKQREALFNIAFFRSVLILDLHDWELRLGYELEQRNFLTGGEGITNIIFYDNRLFFSLALTRFDVGGYGSRPTQFLIDRQRPSGSDFQSPP